MKIRERTLVAKRRRFVGGVTATLGAVAALSLVFVSGALAAQPPVTLGTTTSYAVLAGSTVTNTGPTVLSGDLGLSPGSAVTGFPPGIVIGNVNIANAAAVQAQTDLTTAYLDVEGRGPVTETISADLGGRTLTPGVYNSASSMGLTGALTLDAQGDSGAVFIFQAGSTLTTATASEVKLINGASACNVFWQVGSSATLLATTSFKGTILALTSITLVTGATVDGRLLARNGAVTLDSNLVNAGQCSAAPVRTPTTITTQVHTPSHADITNGSAVVGTPVHDSATVTGASPTGTVTYHFYGSGQGTCSGPFSDETVPVGSESSAQTLPIGSYAYKADYSGDANNEPSTGVCEPFSIVAAPDTTPPICVIIETGKDAAGHGFIRFAVTDSGGGLNRHDITYRRNAAVDVEAYASGAAGPVHVLATAIDPSKSLGVEVRFYDLAGNRAICDPIVTVVRRVRAQPKDQTFTGIAQAECMVTITNGRPGLRSVVLIVNGRKYRSSALHRGEVRKFNVCKAMRSGNRNKITVRARGQKGGSATITIADIN